MKWLRNFGYELEIVFWAMIVNIAIWEVGCRMLLGFSFIESILGIGLPA